MSNKPLRITLVIIGLLLISPFALLLFLHFNGQRELRAAEAALRAKGEKLTPKELAPPLPPAGDNGFNEVTAALRKFARFDPPPFLRFVEPGRAEVIIRSAGWSNYVTKGTNTWADAETWLDQSAEGLEALRDALRKPAFNGNLDYSLGFKLLLPHLTEFKKGAQLMNTAALADLRAGSIEDALINLQAACEMDRVLKDEPLLISQLVRIAMDTITLNTVWQFLNSREWSDGELIQMQTMLPPPARAAAMAKSLEMERALALHGLEEVRRGEMDMADLEWLDQPGFGPRDASDFFGQVLQRPGVILTIPIARPVWKFAFFDESVAHYLGTAQQMIESARKSVVSNSQRSYDFVMLNVDEDVSLTNERIRHWFTYMILPALEKSLFRSFRLETQQSLTSAAIALQRYRFKHGKYPTTLTELLPEFLPGVPLDYMNGQPLRYLLKEDGNFVLYSVGDDGVDDGGDPRPSEAKKKMVSLFDGRDYVWPEPIALKTK